MSDLPYAPARFELVTLGTVVLVGPGGELVLQKSKLLAILSWILASPRKTVTRTQLADMFWGDSSPLRASRSLRTALYRIRSALGESAPDHPGPEIHLSVPVTTDRDVFVGALEAGDLEVAVSTYTGPFFSEYSDAGTADFEHWVDIERARLEELYLHAAHTLVQRFLNTARAREAVDLAHQVRRAAPDAEAGWRLLLQALVAHRDQFAARIEAQAFARWLEQRHRASDPASSRILDLVRGEGVKESADSPETFVAELVGREREFAAIMTAWDYAVQGQARHLHLSSPAGYGKTRLLEEAARRIRTMDSRVIMIRALLGERDVGFALAASLARELAMLPGAGGIPPDSMRVLVALQPALSSRYPGAMPAPASPDLALQRSQALTELVSALAEDHPIALLVDDLHWADSESRRILRAISGRVGKHRVLLVTTSRPGYGDLGGNAEVFPLPALSLAETELLLTAAGTFPTPECSGRLARALNQATGGSPLLIVDSLRRACDRGELALRNGSWTSPNFEALLGKLEAEDRLETRLANLDQEDRHLLLLLAVAGAPWGMEDLAELSGRPLSEVRTRLGAMERLGYVAPWDRAWDLTNEDVAETMLGYGAPEEIRSANLAIGCRLADQATDRVTAARAARHLAAAGAGNDLLGIVRKWVFIARNNGDRSRVDALVRRLLGPGFDDTVTWVVDALPWNVRYRLPAAALAIVVAVGALLGGLTLARGLGSIATNAEAELVVYAVDPSTDAGKLVRYPVSRALWTRSTPVDPEEGSGTEEWRDMGRTTDVVPSPDGRRTAFARITGDSGVMDLFLREGNGMIRRLTSTPGDDVEPSWSPDGRFLVFRTMRWNPTGEFALGLLEVASGAVHQLTGGNDSDWHPRWSPDGSRIGFVRRSDADGAWLLCWITFDGSRSRCLDKMPAVPKDLAGWSDSEHLVLTTTTADWKPGPLLSVALSTGATQVILPGISGRPFLGSNGEWMTIAGMDSTRIFRIDEPMRWRSLAVSDESRTWFKPRRRLPGPSVLRPASSGFGFVGVPQFLAIDADSTAVLGFPAEVLTWRPRDTVIAVVIPDPNAVLPRKVGTTTIDVSAGGWLTASVRFTVTEPWSRVVFSEPWDDLGLSRWETVGTPKPLVVSDERGNRAFFINGDNTFESGVVTREAFQADSGLGFEARIRIPITETKWQFIHLTLGRLARIIDYGEFLIDGCPFSFPVAEGRATRKIVGFKADAPGGGTRGPVELGDGNWHRIRIQVFPDRTCGYALDGIPFARSTKLTVPLSDLRLGISGQSVGTRILVGPVEIWKGVRTDVDWRIGNRE